MKTKWLISILAVILMAGCSDTGNESKQKETDGKASSVDKPSAPAQENSDSSQMDEDQKESDETATDEGQKSSDEPVIDKEQKEMALNMLRDLVKDAKEGKVYSQEEFIVGKTTREDVHKRLGDSEVTENGYDRYTGSMGNPSLAFSYDEKGVLKEARYFGTNVDRQTNLGGITTEDLTELLGKPEEIRLIEATGEKNYVFHVGDYELQFIIGDNDTPDHVNLKGW